MTRKMLEVSAAGRAGTPDEVGTVGALLMGPDGAFTTGSDFLMDGGVTAACWFGELAPKTSWHFLLAASKGRGVGLCLLNPQPNPQNAMSCTTYAAFGSPRVLVSCCKAISRSAVTAEVASSSLVVPANFSITYKPSILRR
jgi:hypothetical protein